MKLNLIKRESDSVTFDISVSAEEWQKFLQSTYELKKDQYNVEGFEEGKAPKAEIEKVYGKNVFIMDAFNSVYYESCTKILQENNDIDAYDLPNPKIKKMDKSGIEFSLKIPCLPKFELGQYKGMTFKKNINTVTDEMLEKQIDEILFGASKLIETKKKARLKDLVTIDFEGFIDGVAFEGGKFSDYQLELGSQTFVGNFEQQLLGVLAGDEKNINVPFPQNYRVPDYAGKNALFKVKVKAVKTRHIPKLSEFVEQEGETVEEFTNNIRNYLIQREDERAQRELELEIINKITDNTTLTVPELLIEKEVKVMTERFEKVLEQQGLKLEDYNRLFNISPEQFKNNYHELAMKTLKSRLVLQKLIEKEKLTATTEQYENKVKQLAERHNKTEEEFKASMDLKETYDAALNDIIFEFLKQNNKIV